MRADCSTQPVIKTLDDAPVFQLEVPQNIILKVSHTSMMGLSLSFLKLEIKPTGTCSSNNNDY
jgi:hypothetical protein